jgi:hypothetical protein
VNAVFVYLNVSNHSESSNRLAATIVFMKTA